jgi:hypothetical protein
LTVKSWDANAKSLNLLDSVGLMVYENADSLKYVDLYTGERCAKQNSCPLCTSAKVGSPCSKVPKNQIVGGLAGGASQASIN